MSNININRRQLVTAAALSAVAAPIMTSTAAVAAPNYAGKFVGHFVYPRASVSANETLFNTMKADAITFGGKLAKVSLGSFPAPVQNELRKYRFNRFFTYSKGVSWDYTRYYVSTVVVNGVHWDLIPMHNTDAVVVTTNAKDYDSLLIDASKRAGARAIIGLPVHPKGRQVGSQWVSYLPSAYDWDVLEHFTYRIVDEYSRRGAHGFYHTLEMPMTDTAFWAPVRDHYTLQNRMIQLLRPGMVSLISPYFESRYAKAEFTPQQAANGARQLLGTAAGTNILIAPQDGLGAGTTALASDGWAGRVAPLENYLAAIQPVLGHRLYVNAEGMRPGGGTADTRTPTDLNRIKQQLAVASRYSRGSIGYMWDGKTPLSALGVGFLGAGKSTI